MRPWLSNALLLTVLLPGVAFAQAGGSISGTIIDQAGHPISGVSVTALRWGGPPASATAASDSAGGFVHQNLPLGTYHICVQSPSGLYLDPCWWNDPIITPPVAVPVGPAQSVTGVTIKLQSAAKLQVRINDPQQLLSGLRTGRDVGVEILTATRLYFLARLAATDVGGRTFEAPIPSGQTVKVLITPVHVGLLDSTGARVPAGGATATVTHPTSASSAPTSLSFTVSGVL